jgi:tRNA(Ser,Leu) C12 N-acetylase TAN1
MSNLNELTGKEVNEGIETDSGGFSLTNSGIGFYRLLTIRHALQAQMRGMRLSSKIPQGTTLARRHLGFRGNKESLLQQVNELIDRIQAERKQDAEEA